MTKPCTADPLVRAGPPGPANPRTGRLLALLLLAALLPAQEPLVEQGYDHFYNLEYPEALRCFEAAAARHPDDPELHNHIAEALVFQEMYRDGALESELVSGTNSFLRRPKLNPSPDTERRFLAEVNRALALADERTRKNPRDAAAWYAQGIAYGLRSNYFWVVRKSWRDSLRDATAARRAHTRVTEIEPDNVDARLVQGLHDYILGSLPWGYRMLGFLVGLHGDKQRGIATVQLVAREGRQNRVEAEVFLGALYRRENQPARAVPLIEDLIRRFPRNYLLRLELSQMYSMAGDKVHALEAVRGLEILKKAHAPGYDRVPWEKIWFQEGTIQFWYRDFDQALENLKRVTAAPTEVDLNTGVSAWLRIGQIYDMTGRRRQAVEAYKRAVAYAPEADAAQESKRYLASPYRR
jgi:tetratricopeptide (TPR) repeat protein